MSAWSRRSSAARGQATVLALAALLGCSPEPTNDDHATLRVVLPREVADLDPRFVTDPYGLKVSRLIFASLVTLDPTTLEVVPDLAESLQRLPDEEGRPVYEATLRSNLRFSDGSVLDARDVVATFDALRSPELGSVFSRNYARIVEVVAEDALHVRFVLDAPHATFPTDLEIPIVRAEDASRRLAWRDEPPVGAGPYVLQRGSDGTHLVLHANPRWHRGAPTHARLRFDVVRDDNTRALRLLGGKADLALNAIPPILVPLFESDPRFEVRTSLGVGTTYLGFHTERVPLEVRRAIALAVDRRALVDAKLGGHATVTESWIPRAHWAATPLPERAFDPAAARASVSDDVRPLVLRVSSDRFRVSVARAIAAMLSDVGLRVDVRPSEPGTLIEDLNEGRFDLCLLQVPEVIEPHVLSWFFGSDRVPGEGLGGANRWRLRDAELDAALEAGRVARDTSERLAAYETAQRRLYETLPVLPLWQEENLAVVRRGLAFEVPRDGRFGRLAHP
ncbi:MAG: ABC transporter substrate-binding protein [Myxococcales bacterium]|nr:ABC transporter substrate-binding protein [Myxococcales bacterium]